MRFEVENERAGRQRLIELRDRSGDGEIGVEDEWQDERKR
jgi:hypothetical protein